MTERTSIFDRNYDFDTGKSEILLTTGEKVGDVDFSTMHPDSIRRFALAGATSYAINAATQSAKRKEAPLSFRDGIAEALKRVSEGTISIGGGVTVDKSATGLLAAALLHLGKTKIVFAGDEWSFTNQVEAKAAAKALYDSPKEQVIKDTNGKPIRALTGRQLFSALTAQKDVAEFIATVKAKREADLGDFMG